MESATKQTALRTIKYSPFRFFSAPSFRKLPHESSFGPRNRCYQSFGVDRKVALGDLIKQFPLSMKRMENEAGVMVDEYVGGGEGEDEKEGDKREDRQTL